MNLFKFSTQKLIISILIILASLSVFIYMKLTCMTGRNCSIILPEQWPFVIIGLLSIIYIITIIIPKKQ